MDPPAIKKQLKIKTGVIQRLIKENALYKKEIEQGVLKRDKFIAEGAEEWDIKNAGKLIEESEKMVKDTATRLAAGVSDLRALVLGVRERGDMNEDEELLKAEEALETASA
ncbi:tubulin binding cofactor A [Coprinopsis sp. MPI-PUGE-AT-0042]|nr:tubulin binding cofactor A [Coprinopsis sp. MPI-PUGE-AT-0042]